MIGLKWGGSVWEKAHFILDILITLQFVGLFFKYRKLYSRCCKRKLKEFKTTLITQIDNLYENDPEAYWKLIKDSKEESNVSDPSQSIAADDWLQHFSNLII